MNQVVMTNQIQPENTSTMLERPPTQKTPEGKVENVVGAEPIQVQIPLNGASFNDTLLQLHWQAYANNQFLQEQERLAWLMS